jgi:RNA polymerase sigma-70 factor, ECF subfamily
MAFRRLDTFRGDASFKTWLLTIAWHQAINHRRSLSRVWRRMVAPKDQEEMESVLENVAASGPTPEGTAAHHELRREVERAIRSLSPKLRDALLLAQSDEYSYDEIATMLRAPVGTIKWRVFEARRVVRATLQQRGYVDVR